MRWIPDRYGGLRSLLGGARPARDVDDQFEFHLQCLTEELVRRGMSPGEAQEEAVRRFGDRATLRQETIMIEESIRREARRAELVSSLAREVRIALRSLRRSPGFTVAAVLTLGLGIGATTSIFTLLDAVVLRPLPYAKADRLVQVTSDVPGLGEGSRFGLSVAGYFHFRENSRTLESLGHHGWGEGTLSGDFAAERVSVAIVSADLLDVLGIVPAHGRPFQAEEERPGASPVVILGHAFWQARFGGDEVLGRTIRLQGVDREIIGVMPPGVHLPQRRVAVWQPVSMDPAAAPVNAHWVTALGRLRPGVTAEDARRELARLTARFPELFPGAYSQEFMERYGFATRVDPLHGEVVGGMARTLWMLLAAVGLVLLIACANVANLFLVRLEARRREVAVRRALGAGRRALAGHFFGESLLIGAGAVVLGVVFAYAGTRALVAMAPPNFPRLEDVGLTGGAVLTAVSLGVTTALVFGLLPLLRARGRFDTLHEGGRASASPRQRAARSVLIVAQTALALVLLAAAGLMLQSYRQLQSVELGFEPRDAMTFQVALPPMRYQGWDPVLGFYRQLTERIEALDGVVAAGVTGMLPPVAGTSCAILFPEDVPARAGEEPRCLGFPLASPGAYRALGMRLRGEAPTWDEMETGAAGVVVTRSLAERFWPGEDPIGRGIVGNNPGPPYYRIVGVVDDVRAHGVDRLPVQAVFFPMRPMEGAPLWAPLNFGDVVVRTSGVPPLAMLPMIRSILTELDPEVPLANPRTMEDVVGRSDSVARASFAMLLLLTAGSMALVLSAIGMFGVISYTVAQRTGEMAIRIALGARTAAVKGLVVRQSLVLVGLGIALGLLAALAGLRLMQSLLFEVTPAEPRVLGAVVLVLAIVASAASYLPARRAARVDPMVVLRSE
jgi:putative ABC transport system permease protein